MKLKIDNPFFDAMGRLGDIIAVNVLFLLCSLPIVTVGGAVYAMYGVFLRMEEGTEGSVPRTFFRCFAEGFRKCMPVWMLMLLSGAVLAFDVLFLGHVGMRGFWKAVAVVTGCLILLWEFLYAWIFAALAAGRKAKEAMRLSIQYLPATLAMALLNNIPLLLLILGVYYLMLALPPYLVCGFALTAYVNTRLMKKGLGRADGD